MTKNSPARHNSMAAAPSEAEPLVSTPLASGVYLLLALLYFLPGFLPGQQLFGTDFTVSGYFYYDFLSARFAQGELPKWVPYVYGGVPLFSNPGSTFYPGRFLVDLLLPTSRMLAGVFVLQFAAAGIGMYLLAREVGCRSWVAFVAGLAFQFTGITLSWVYAGHDGRIIVATLSPLFLMLLHRGIRKGSAAPFAGAAATLGLALLSFQIQNAYYLLLAGAIWAVFALVHLKVVASPPALAKAALFGVGCVAFGFALAAVNFLPFRDYVGESPRGAAGGRGWEYSVSYSMPVADILGIAVPEQSGASVFNQSSGEPLFPEYHGPNGAKLHSEYLGALVVVLVALGFAYCRKNRYWLFFVGLTLFQLSLSFGGNTPLYRLYYNLLPGLKRFRAPDLAFFLAAIALIVVAALTLEAMAALRDATARERRPAGTRAPFAALPWVVAGILAVVLIGAAMAGGDAAAGVGAPTRAQGWGRFALFVAAAGAALWAWSNRRMTASVALIVLSVVTVADLWIIGKRFLQTVPPPDALYAEDDVVQFLRSQPQPARVWVLELGEAYRMRNYLMRFGIDQVAGEHGNQLQRYNELLGAGRETYVDYHNLLRNPQVVETPQGQAATFGTHPGILAAANVRYIISMVPLALPGFREVHRGSALVYENVAALPRAYLAPAARVVRSAEESLKVVEASGFDPRAVAVVQSDRGLDLPSGPLLGDAVVTEYQPDRVVVRATASRAALLVLADNMYEGWTARIDGQPAPIFRANHAFRGVLVPAGMHEVTFEFEPRDLYTGLYISLAGFALLALFGIFLLLRSRRSRRSDAAPAE